MTCPKLPEANANVTQLTGKERGGEEEVKGAESRSFRPPRQSHVDARVTSRHTNAQTCWQQKQRGEANFFSLREGGETGGRKRGRKGDYNLIRGRKSC